MSSRHGHELDMHLDDELFFLFFPMYKKKLYFCNRFTFIDQYGVYYYLKSDSKVQHVKNVLSWNIPIID